MSEYRGEDWYAQLCEKAVAIARQEDYWIKQQIGVEQENLNNYLAEVSRITGIDRQKLDEHMRQGQVRITLTDSRIETALRDADHVLQFDGIIRTAKHRAERAKLEIQMKEIDAELKKHNFPALFH